MERNYSEGGFSNDRATGSFKRWRGRGGSWRGNKRREATQKVTGDDDRERERPPPGLRGKEIGLWHARRSQARKQQQELLNRPTIAIDSSKQSNIRRLLNNIAEADNVPPEVLCDFDNVNDKKTEWGWKEEEASDLRPISGLSTPSWSDSGKLDRWEKLDSWENILDEEEEVGLKDHCSSKIGQASSSQSDFTLSHSPKGSLQTDLAPDTAQPGSSQQHQPIHFNSCLPVGGAGVCGNDEREELLDVPQVSELLEYNRVHGDLLYLDQTMDLEMKQEQGEIRLERNPALDEHLNKEAAERLLSRSFQKMLDFRKKLPSYTKRQELVKLIRENQVLVVSGETGCGKTTQVPQFVLDDFIERGMGSLCHIICTQPRRISAVSVAERVASERCEKCGGDGSSVGYQIRLEVRQPRKQGSLLFCTTGIILKFLEKDPLLMRATHIILDEIHERDLQSDFLMIILKDILPRRPDLKIVLMSATLNANMFSKYFKNCPMVNIPGFTFPVQEFLLEDVLQMTGYQPDSSRKPKLRSKKKTSEREDEEEWNFQAWLRNLDKKYSSSTLKALSNFDYSRIDLDLIVTLLHHIIRRMEDGAILVFVPGWQEISSLHKMLQDNSAFASGCRVIPLHSLMPTVNQREVFDRPPAGIRKIVIATNIAETSITIDDVVFVVDCGKIKVKDYNPSTNLTCLEPQLVSRANARQRRGRAGRVQAGYCYHLFTSLQLLEMRDYLPPEMLRTRLEELCLQIKLLKLGRIEPFVRKAMQPPSMEALHRAIVTLKELNALDSEENLLPLGVHLARMPVDPHTGKMILFGAMFCCLDPILTVAASLSFKDAFFIPLGKEKEADSARKELSQGSNSDHIVLINAMKGWEKSVSQGSDRQFCWDYFLSSSTLKMLRDMKKQLAELLFDLNFVASKDPKDVLANIHSEDLGLVKAVLCAGLYPHVARVVKAPRPGDPPYKTVGVHLKNGNGKVGIHPKSVNCRVSYFPSKWLVYYHILKTTQVYIHDCTMVSPYPLLFFGGSINIIMDNGQECISVDDWIVFNASQSTAQLVLDLRHQLDKLLADKIVLPGVTCWKQTEKEGALMRAIAELISAEEVEGCVGVEKESGQGGSGQRHGGWKDRPKYSHRK